MKKSIHTIIENLDAFTQNRLRKWLQSPAHNHNQALIPLLETLVSKKKGEKRVESSENTADLSRRLREFLAYEYWQNDAVQQQVALAAQLYQLGYTDFGNDVLLRAEPLHDAVQPHNGDWQMQHYDLLVKRERAMQQTVRATGITRTDFIAKTIDIAYFTRRLSLFIDAISYNNVLKLNIKTDGYLDLLVFIEKMDLQNEPLVALHIALLRVLTDEQEEAHFHTAITLLNAHYALLNPYEQRDRYLVVINYAIRKINKGEIIYFQKTLDFYKTLLENKTLLQNNILQVWDYKNIITAGLRVENYDWVETFLYEYNEKLPDSFRENALNYNLAKLNFDRKNYKKVIDLLQIVEYSDFTYIFGSRSTLLKTYYELGEYEAMESAAESFRLFLLRNKTASINTKKSYQNFIRFIKKAIKIPKNQPLLREKLIANIHETSLIADKKWLLEKLTDKITDKI